MRRSRSPDQDLHRRLRSPPPRDIGDLSRPTPTLEAAQRFWQNEKGSNDRPSPTTDRGSSCRSPDFSNLREFDHPLIYLLVCQNADNRRCKATKSSSFCVSYGQRYGIKNRTRGAIAASVL